MTAPKHYAEVYRLLLEHPPEHINHAGDTVRKRGCACHEEYWRGYDGHRSHAARTSPGYAAWMAGRDAARVAR